MSTNTPKKKKSNHDKPKDFLADLAAAGLSGDLKKVEMITLTAVRTLKKSDPNYASVLADVLSKYTTNTASLRWAENPPPPTDRDEGSSLLQFPSVDNCSKPLFNEFVSTIVCDFITQRQSSSILISEGLAPPRSILLKGAPGTGKTALSSWFANKLELPLVVLDLASSVSSYLGKTGSNLKRSLNYARNNPCVFLLDEFDSIAKRRDDSSDVGELKRIVNVLLKEIEDWSLSSVLVAATNHPEMLDPAIERRFDVVITIPLPEADERKAILNEKLGRFASGLPTSFLDGFAKALAGQSGSGLETITNSALRQHLIHKRQLIDCLCEAYVARLSTPLPKELLTELIVCLKKEAKMTARAIASLLGKSPSTIQHHINKHSKNAR